VSSGRLPERLGGVISALMEEVKHEDDEDRRAAAVEAVVDLLAQGDRPAGG
jgi:hypothetical protein